MPKNKRTLILSERLQELIEIKQDEDITLSQTQQAKQMEIPHQNFAKYVNDEAECSISTICKIAKYYGVSTDYLLGLTDIKSTDTTIQSICEYTGLSELVALNLNMWKKAKNDNRDIGFHNIETLNILFETPSFFILLFYLRLLNRYSSETLKDADKSTNGIDVGEMLENDKDSDLCRYKVSELINDIMNEKFDNRKIQNDTYHQIIDKFR